MRTCVQVDIGHYLANSQRRITLPNSSSIFCGLKGIVSNGEVSNCTTIMQVSVNTYEGQHATKVLELLTTLVVAVV